MRIGVPTEIKSCEYRVGLVPAGAEELTRRGHEVLVQSGAGLGSSIPDAAYKAAGARLIDSPDTVYAEADLIVKVKEPQPEEYPRIRPAQLLFTYFHFAASQELTEAMLRSRATCIAYETMENDAGHLPLLVPMSEVAGRMAVHEGAKYLEKPMEGRGILLAGVPGVAPANVLILGGGVVGTNAAKMAAGLGAHVTILDVDLDRLRYLDDILPKNVRTLMSNAHNIREALPHTDLLIGAVLISGARAPRLVTRSMLGRMKLGSVIIDVAVDQGGCVETCHPTTHAEPTFIVDGVVHYCVANMPGAVAGTSTLALTNATLPYVVEIAEKGYPRFWQETPCRASSINLVEGRITYAAVADAFDLEYTPLDAVS